MIVKALVPDTNFWLHAKRPFDFQSIADGDQFMVVVPGKVLSELDKHAHEGRKGIRKRARDVQMGLRKLIPRGRQETGLLETVDESGLTYWFVTDVKVEPGTSADEQIVATALTLARDAEVIIVTSDAAMEMASAVARLRVHSVSQDLLEEDEPDSLEQEVASLKKKLEKLEQPEPLNVQVVSEVLYPETDPIEILRLDQPSAAEIDELRKQIQARLNFSNPAYAGHQTIAFYNAGVPQYAATMAGYLASRARWEAEAETGIYVQLLVINRTRLPIHHAILELIAPPHVIFEYPGPQPEIPKPLPSPLDLMNPPTQYEKAMLDITKMAHGSPFWTIPAIKPVRTRGPWLQISKGTIESRIDDPLRPDYDEFAGKVWIGFEPEFPDSDLEIPFVLYAAASKPFKGTMQIKLSHRHERWTAPELPSQASPSVVAISRSSQRERWEIRDVPASAIWLGLALLSLLADQSIVASR